MTRRNRLAVLAVAVIASLSGGGFAAGAAHADEAAPDSSSPAPAYWYCVGVERIDLGYCQANPLPERLPLPEQRPRL